MEEITPVPLQWERETRGRPKGSVKYATEEDRQAAIRESKARWTLAHKQEYEEKKAEKALERAAAGVKKGRPKKYATEAEAAAAHAVHKALWRERQTVVNATPQTPERAPACPQ